MINITSLAFSNNEMIPRKYACDGMNMNPPLFVSNVPEKAQSLVLIVSDPDAKMGVWTHWIVFNIDPGIEEIKENSLPQNGILGASTSGKIGYEGPCPPKGEIHRYFFKIYAIDMIIEADEGVDINKLERIMEGHIIEEAELMGIYEIY
ncbi:MAG: YbhB/YbcL family Raf kinase inhibitor-like protein [Candidatus Pacebacteria bacterium]|nr:YbhB/YbcL family Raf kinase inhibitor-like protein [Candidatus Paceibacterota bacterium]